MTDPSRKKVDDLKKILEGKKKEPDISQEKIQSAEAEAKKYEEEAKQNHDKLLRLMAEFENYKKRMAKDQEDRIKFSHEALIKEMLPVLDDFDRVLEHLPTQSSPEIQNLTEGVQLIHRHFLTALKKFELQEVEALGKPFNPHEHEAIAQIESGEHAEGQIVACHRRGYRLHHRLIRPASVTVAKAKGNNENNEAK